MLNTVKTIRHSLATLRGAPAASESNGTSANQGRSQAEAFVLMVTVEVLKRSGAMEGQTLEKWTDRSAHLIQKIMEGLTLEPGLSPNPHMAKGFAKEVRRHLDRTYPSKVKQLLSCEDPHLETSMVRYIHQHIQDQCGRTWNILLKRVLMALAFFISLFMASAFCMLV